MKFTEKLLLALSKPMDIATPKSIEQEWTIDNALFFLDQVFPDFQSLIRGKDVLDFGCGEGYQTAALVKEGANYCLGVDSNEGRLKKARMVVQNLPQKDRLEFRSSLDGNLQGKFDIVISQNSMEHFPAPEEILETMKAAAKPNGLILITFGPPWLAPYGSHMKFFTSVPWVNILFDEETVMNVRSRFRNDGARRYEEVEAGLNKMTAGKFERIIKNAGMKVLSRNYNCVKKLNFLGHIPYIRELFINQINCILQED